MTSQQAALLGKMKAPESCNIFVFFRAWGLGFRVRVITSSPFHIIITTAMNWGPLPWVVPVMRLWTGAFLRVWEHRSTHQRSAGQT